ncbi:hypothetical protein SCLCIDRAFT_123247 [Scleroderma citrinum Foug A]|uniref:Major facilitator superfamily (MFS) profile domain-containing protein n=1 Tax=Scleroderma citrinum Foug A TaxID=1036808 RepID=A0A0C3DXM5_9AGAM|nr:hypothetical protein SCLCIDRAFT_123247 [Scleroderma citrinum Foug A]
MSQDHSDDTTSTSTIKDGRDLEDSSSQSSDSSPISPYTIYTLREKWAIVSMVSFAAFFCSFAANSYLPTIPILATDFHKSAELMNLTVTVYMVFQAIFPMCWGTLSDHVGRRPILLACLLVLCFASIGLALIPTSAYWLLSLLRCIQAAGSAGTLPLGAGVIGDISTRAERGGFIGLFFVGVLFGPTIGPVIGGVLAQTLGWRSIFWLVSIGSALFLVFLLTFLPETLRRLVGNGSILPPKIYRPLAPLVGRGRQGIVSDRAPRPPLKNPFRILICLDVLVLLLFNAIQYAMFYAFITPLSTLSKSTYPHLNETEIGLCYLAPGSGIIIGGYVHGKILDRDYRLLKEKLIQEREAPTGASARSDEITSEENFPIEKVRMKRVPVQLFVCVACCASYGWCLQHKVNLAVPLVLQFIFCFAVRGILNSSQTLLIDLLPTQGSSVTACNNLIGYSFGAACIAVIDLVIRAVGTGWTYTIFAAIDLSVGPMIWLLVWLGPRSRARRLTGKVEGR